METTVSEGPIFKKKRKKERKRKQIQQSLKQNMREASGPTVDGFSVQ